MIEEDIGLLVDDAWPAPGRVTAGGWVYRHAAGVTKRANSVLPRGPQERLGAAVNAAERFYASRGLPTVFSVDAAATPGLDGELAARGYRVVDPTLMLTRPLTPEDDAPAGDGRPQGVVLAPRPDAAWMDTWWRVDGPRHPSGAPGATDSPARDMGGRILTGRAAVYAAAGGGVAVGRGVRQGEWFGVYCMAVVPGARRRGHATDILRALLSEGRRQGAKRAYLVVTEANTGARALYERAGFTVSDRYHYRVR